MHSLTANFVEYYVGGVSAADRDNVRDLVEDAILNCRSALDNGIGYGAGFEGLRATQRYNDDLNNMHDLHGYSSDLNLKKIINEIIFKSYETIIMKLYKSAGMSDEAADKLVTESLDKNRPFNIRDESFDSLQVYTSIETDPAILDAISKIITIMYTSDQALLIDPMQNAYIEDDEDEE